MVAMVAESPFAFELRQPPLTADLLGQLFVMQWSKQKRESRLPERSRLNEVILDQFPGAPESVRSILHVDYRLQKPEVVEITDFLFAAQRVGMVERPNPSHVPCISRLSSYWADWFLEDDQLSFGEELEWLSKVVEKL